MTYSVTKASILIVDDTPVNLRLLSQMLTQQGFEIRAVNSGQRALESVKVSPPDLILLDIMMRGMNGYEVCQHLKADPATRDIPVIFISALDAADDKVNAFAAGGVDYVTKPFQIEEVMARVQTHLALRDLQKQLQAANRQLEQQVEELQAQNQELDAFSHTVAHDLKAPVGLVVGYACIIEEDCDRGVYDDVKTYAHLVARGGRKLNNIIHELLLLASARKAEVEMQPLTMPAIVAEAQGRLADLIEVHHAELALPADWPPTLGYAPWVEEVWVNYISNAIKYGGQPPRVELGADWPAHQGEPGGPGMSHSPFLPEEDKSAALAEGNESGMVRLWVKDNGAGLSPEEQARLFTPFTRIQHARAEGHGLGLSIVHRIVEKLGGQVGVESVVGLGSCFYFTLPAAAVVKFR